jgi:hypothetical protein
MWARPWFGCVDSAGRNERPKGLRMASSDLWWTPPQVLALIESAVGDPIALDPFPRDWDPSKPDGFAIDWATVHTFCNPPYSRLRDFARAFDDAAELGRKWRQQGRQVAISALVPAYTDTRWFERLRCASSVIAFHRGRIGFGRGEGGESTVARFPSAIAYAGPFPGRFCDTMRAAGHWAVIA